VPLIPVFQHIYQHFTSYLDVQTYTTYLDIAVSIFPLLESENTAEKSANRPRKVSVSQREAQQKLQSRDRSVGISPIGWQNSSSGSFPKTEKPSSSSNMNDEHAVCVCVCVCVCVPRCFPRTHGNSGNGGIFSQRNLPIVD